MKLITKEIEKKAPAIGTTGEMDPSDIKVVAKFFFPAGNWTWYMTEYDPEERLCFGFVIGHENELGYWSMDELEEIFVNGLRVERDRWFAPGTWTLEQVMKGATP